MFLQHSRFIGRMAFSECSSNLFQQYFIGSSTNWPSLKDARRCAHGRCECYQLSSIQFKIKFNSFRSLVKTL